MIIQEDRRDIFLSNLQSDIRTASKLFDTFLEFKEFYKSADDVIAAVEVLIEAQRHVNDSFLSVIETILKQKKR